MDQIAIGARIKAARERVHLTQEQLAEIIDISPTHMSVIERGVKTPKLDTFVRIANALGVSTDALLQDVVVPVNDSIMAELSARIGRMSQKDQERILNAIRALTELEFEGRETDPHFFCFALILRQTFPFLVFILILKN